MKLLLSIAVVLLFSSYGYSQRVAHLAKDSVITEIQDLKKEVTAIQIDKSQFTEKPYETPCETTPNGRYAYSIILDRDLKKAVFTKIIDMETIPKVYFDLKTMGSATGFKHETYYKQAYERQLFIQTKNLSIAQNKESEWLMNDDNNNHRPGRCNQRLMSQSECMSAMGYDARYYASLGYKITFL
jgi:hypothetical protein